VFQLPRQKSAVNNTNNNLTTIPTWTALIMDKGVNSYRVCIILTGISHDMAELRETQKPGLKTSPVNIKLRIVGNMTCRCARIVFTGFTGEELNVNIISI
jgi:hypothetical protein